MTSDNTRIVRRLQLAAGLMTLIGIVGLFALLTQDALALDPPRPGFPPGARGLPNPFANTSPGGAPGNAPKREYYDENSDDDEDFGDDSFPSYKSPTGGTIAGSGSGGSTRGAPAANGDDEAGGSNNGISMGGNTGGVIANNKKSALRIDSETGEGSKETVTDFNFPDADILDIAKTLGKLTGKNFILDKDVKGRITIISNSQITVADAWKAFLTALDINGFALIPSGNFIRIARNRDARDKQVRTYTGDSSPDTDALITRVFPLKYIQAEEVARTFRSFTPPNARIIPYEQTNTVIVTDTGTNITKLAKMLEILDIEGYDAGIEVIPVKIASAGELAKLIDTLIPGTGNAPGAPGRPNFGGGGRGGFSARRTKEGGIINTIIADERTNTLIVHANGKGADQVRELVAKLDQIRPNNVGGGKVHVIYLQFAEAEKIANTLNSLSAGGKSGGSSAPGGPPGGIGVNPSQGALFEGNIKISADVATNALVVTASPADFDTVRRVVSKLDILRDQVFVEAVIMEIELDKGNKFSANVINPSSGLASVPNGDLFASLIDPTKLGGGVIGFSAGGTKQIPIGNGQFQTVSSVQGLITAIQSNTKSNVLATPQIIALDNTEATFDSSENIPVPSSTQVQGAGVTQSVGKEKVGISITIKPRINKSSNFVQMDVTAKLGDVSDRPVPSQLAAIAVATTERSAKTTVVIGDSDTAVLGGLQRDKKSEKVTKVPILGDIPILGWLFKATESASQKTNLLIFLTPHIVRQYDKVRAILDKKLQERDEFLEENSAGEDPNRLERNRIIRSLPNIEDLKKKPQNSVSIDDEDSAPGANAVPPADGAKPAGPLKADPGTPGTQSSFELLPIHTTQAAPQIVKPKGSKR